MWVDRFRGLKLDTNYDGLYDSASHCNQGKQILGLTLCN